MPQRETQGQVILNQWKGIDERTQPTLVQNGFFSSGRGIFFGQGDNAERIPGKRPSALLDGPVYQIFAFGDSVFVQTQNALWKIPQSEVTTFFISFTPLIPDAPAITNLSFFSLTVTMPALTKHATSQNLQRSTDGINWTTTNTGLASLQVISVASLTDATLYYFRAVAVNVYTTQVGIAATTTTPARLPDVATAPTFGTVTTTTIDVVVPALAGFATTQNLQSSPDNSTWTTISTNPIPGTTVTDSGLTIDTLYYYRAAAINSRGTTVGTVASKKTNSSIPAGTIQDETAGYIQDENGNYIVEN